MAPWWRLAAPLPAWPLPGSGCARSNAWCACSFRRGWPFRIDGPVLLFLLIVTTGVAIVVGIVPLLRASDGDLHQVLRESGRGSAGSPRHERLRRTLRGGGAGAGDGAGRDRDAARPKFSTAAGCRSRLSHRERARVPRRAGLAGDDSHEKVIAFSDRLLADLGSLPGVSAVGSDSNLPLSGKPREPSEGETRGATGRLKTIPSCTSTS